MSHVHTANGTIHLTRHDRMMGTLSERLALRHGLSPETAGLVRTAASLHDIGKAAIPNSILEKPGKLTDKEFDLVRLHTVCGYNLLRNLSGPHADMARKIAMYHHERYDGQGYWGMENEIQPIYVKIAALSDVFTALISKRPYKPAWPVDKALAYINDQAGNQFDPQLVQVSVPLMRDFYLSDRAIPSDDGSEGVFDQLLNEAVALGVDYMQKKGFQINSFLQDTDYLRKPAQKL